MRSEQGKIIPTGSARYIHERFSLTDTIAYELKNVSLLSTPPPVKARATDSENELPNHNPKVGFILE